MGIYLLQWWWLWMSMVCFFPVYSIGKWFMLHDFIVPSKWLIKRRLSQEKEKNFTEPVIAISRASGSVANTCTNAIYSSSVYLYVSLCGDMWKCVPLMHLFSNKPVACLIISYFMSLIRIIARKSDSFLLNFNKLIGKTHDWYSI